MQVLQLGKFSHSQKGQKCTNLLCLPTNGQTLRADRADFSVRQDTFKSARRPGLETGDSAEQHLEEFLTRGVGLRYGRAREPIGREKEWCTGVRAGRGDLIVLSCQMTVPYALGLPDVGEEDTSAAEEGVSEPLMGGNDDDDDDDQNYSIQASEMSSSSGSGSTPQPEAIGFFQACCLPGVILVRTYSVIFKPLHCVTFTTRECHKELMSILHLILEFLPLGGLCLLSGEGGSLFRVSHFVLTSTLVSQQVLYLYWDLNPGSPQHLMRCTTLALLVFISSV